MRSAILGFVFGVVITATLFVLTRRNAPNSGTNEEVKEIIIRDTIRLSYPVEIKQEKIDTMFVAVRDTMTIRDTTYIVLPRERKVYKGEDYRAVVSGYEPKLESIEVYPTTKIVERRAKLNRWGVGVQVGVGLSPNGVAFPYIGAGVQYTLWAW